MCTACFTPFDALAMAATGATTVASGGLRRLRDAVAGRTGADRRLAAWEANRAFVTGLGLDPALVLGPPPTAPVARPDRPDRPEPVNEAMATVGA